MLSKKHVFIAWFDSVDVFLDLLHQYFRRCLKLLMDIQQKILDQLVSPDSGFSTHLLELEVQWDAKECSVEGKFFYLPFRNDQPMLDEFIEFLISKMMHFCLPSKEIADCKRRYQLEQDPGLWVRKHEKARRLFIKATEQRKKLGEPAELILFLLLELAIRAPQIVAKMALKTNVNMPVHGSDAIHIRYDDKANLLHLIWGESKLYQSVTGGITEALDSIKTFYESKEDGKPPKDRDMILIQDHASLEDPRVQEVLLQFFDPYNEQYQQLRDHNAIFIGFDYDVYHALDGLTGDALAGYFQNKFRDRVLTACQNLEQKATDKKLTHLQFIFFLLPFKSVQDVRDRFLKELGA